MKEISLLFVAALVLSVGTAAFADGEPCATIQIPGLGPGMILEGVCPRSVPLEADVNSDGFPDLLFPSNQRGKYHEYLPPEAGSQFGLIGALMSLKADTGNKNFTFAEAVDGKSGKMLWEFQAGALINEFSLSADGSRLYLASHDNKLYALDVRTGKPVWSHDFGGNVLALSASDDDIIAMTTRNLIVAMAAADGKQLWEAPVKAGLMNWGWGYFFAEGDSIFAGSLDNRVTCYDRKTGKKRWSVDAAGNPSLRALGDNTLVFVDAKGFSALDAATGNVRWTLTGQGKPYLDPVRHFGDLLLGFNGRHGSRAALFCLEMDSGKERWGYPLEKIPPDKERVVLLPEDQDAFKSSLVAELSRDGSPTTLYVADRAKVSALDAASGKPRWTAPLDKTQALALAGDLLLAQDKKKILTAFDAATGKAIWTQTTPAFLREVVRAGNLLLCHLGHRILLVLDFAQGKTVLQKTLKEPDRLLAWGPDRILLAEGGSARLFTTATVPNTAAPAQMAPPAVAAPQPPPSPGSNRPERVP